MISVMKRTSIFLFFFLLYLFPCYAQNKNLIKNGSFETERSGYVVQWNTEAYLNNDQSVRFFMSDKEYYDGKKSFGIANLKPNDSKIIQWVEVEPDSLYRLSCWIKAKNITGAQVGANISVLGVKGSSDSVLDTRDEWVYVEVYGKTGPAQESFAVVPRLGFYGNLVTGIAYFDDIRLEKVEKSPTRIVLNFFNSEDKVIFLDDKDVRGVLSGTPVISVIILIISFAGIAAGGVFIYIYIVRPFLKRFGRYIFPSSSSVPEGEQIERRKAKRKKLKLTVIVRYRTRKGGYREMTFNSLNISVGGIFLLVDDLYMFKIGDKIELEIQKKGKKYDIGKAKIVRLQKEVNRQGMILEQGIGIQFLATDTRQLTWIMSIMGETRKRKNKNKGKNNT
jgi:hypothetical protein